MTSYAKARILNPARYFELPDLVLGDDNLSRDEKIEVLKSMALDADQLVVTTSEGMAGAKQAYSANDLQSALIQLQAITEPEAIDVSTPQNARFQRIMVITAFDMAEIVGGKVFMLNVVPSTIEGPRLVAAAPLGAAFPLGTIDNAQIIESRKEQLAELSSENRTQIKVEIEVRSGEIEHAIVDYAADCDADIIIVGSPNRSWLETIFVSPIARKVTSSAPCPVLVVPEPA
jgi:nucleotide-binding universal stress UspA family protein